MAECHFLHMLHTQEQRKWQCHSRFRAEPYSNLISHCTQDIWKFSRTQWSCLHWAGGREKRRERVDLRALCHRCSRSSLDLLNWHPLHGSPSSEDKPTQNSTNSPGKGSCTNRPSTLVSSFSLLIKSSSSSSVMEAGFRIVSLLIPRVSF